VPTHEFWREAETGEVWAVELEDGVVSRCCGPLHWSEITVAFLQRGYDYRTEGAPELEARRGDFEPLDEVTVTMIAGSVD
jgi:hypothetical protein